METEKLYLLEILDSEDGYVYAKLLYTSEAELESAKRFVEQFDSNWYIRSFEEEMENGNYYEELMDALQMAGLKGVSVYSRIVYIR